MKATLALTAMLGTAFGAVALPSVGGPVHYRLTRPFSMFATSTNDVATLGAAPLEFVLTDIVISRPWGIGPGGTSGGSIAPVLSINGVPAVQLPWDIFTAVNGGAMCSGKLHLSTGIFVSAGAVVTVSGASLDNDSGVHVSGYVQ